MSFHEPHERDPDKRNADQRASTARAAVDAGAVRLSTASPIARNGRYRRN
jgi:hypothetical protein